MDLLILNPSSYFGRCVRCLQGLARAQVFMNSLKESVALRAPFQLRVISKWVISIASGAVVLVVVRKAAGASHTMIDEWLLTAAVEA